MISYINNKLLIDYLAYKNYIQSKNLKSYYLNKNIDNNKNKNFNENIFFDNNLLKNVNINSIYNNENINDYFINEKILKNAINNNTNLNNLTPYDSNFGLNNYINVNTTVKNIYSPYNINIDNINNNNFLSNNSKNQNLISFLIKSNQNINQSKEKISLTNKLCNKNSINQIRDLLKKSKYDNNLIRQMILILKKENGLHIVFKNLYGNYFIQELFSKMNSDLIQLTIDLISSDFVNIAENPSGTHCLQDLLNYINNSTMEISILKAIKYKEKEMAFDNNATYVLQKIISIIPDSKRIKLNNFILDNTKQLSLNANSVFVIKKFIVTNTNENNKKKMLNNLKNNFLIISQNPFGNYIIQYIFEIWPLRDCEIIINEIYDKVYELSSERFSLNIILKVFNIFSLEYKKKLIYFLLFSKNLLNLLKNKYGNFAIYKAVDNMDNEMKKEFEKFLVKNFNDFSKEKILANLFVYLLKK